MTSYKIEGGVQLAKVFRGLSESEGKAAARTMLRQAAEPMRQEMERLAPRSEDAPHIAENIVISSTTESVESDSIGRLKGVEGEHVVAVGPRKDLFYGIMQEFGTKFHGAQPFVRPAFDTQWQACMKVLQDGIWAFLRTRSANSTAGRGL